mmetsp:Transcript_5775/g.19094  ORF Transcript_5775/g.19094 Transcript_5775/m.19094 type:complete len:272 (+) Transcript_5775:775-1590(+)
MVGSLKMGVPQRAPPAVSPSVSVLESSATFSSPRAKRTARDAASHPLSSAVASGERKAGGNLGAAPTASLSEVSDSPVAVENRPPRMRFSASWRHKSMTRRAPSDSRALSTKTSRSPPSLSLSLIAPLMRMFPPAARNRFAVRGVSIPEMWSMSHKRLCSRNFLRNTSVERSAIVKSPRFVLSPPFATGSNSGTSSSRIVFSSMRCWLIFQSPMASARNINTFFATTHSPSVSATITPKRISANMLYRARSIMLMESAKRNDPLPPMARMK